MDNKALMIEKVKASIEASKACMVVWQTKILSGADSSQKAHKALINHADIISDLADIIKEIK